MDDHSGRYGIDGDCRLQDGDIYLELDRFMKRRKKWLRSAWSRKKKRFIEVKEGISFSAVSIYRGEFERILKEIAAKSDIETGGELFGFYRDDGSPVICYVIGPGPNANHQLAFFNQDLEYLKEAGNILCGRHGLEHIGEWHSHHRLGLAYPSAHDAKTVADGVRSSGRRRFILCVGNIAGNRASLGGFAFTRDSGTTHNRVAWQVIDGASPYRTVVGDI